MNITAIYWATFYIYHSKYNMFFFNVDFKMLEYTIVDTGRNNIISKSIEALKVCGLTLQCQIAQTLAGQ